MFLPLAFVLGPYEVPFWPLVFGLLAFWSQCLAFFSSLYFGLLSIKRPKYKLEKRPNIEAKRPRGQKRGQNHKLVECQFNLICTPTPTRPMGALGPYPLPPLQGLSPLEEPLHLAEETGGKSRAPGRNTLLGEGENI